MALKETFAATDLADTTLVGADGWLLSYVNDILATDASAAGKWLSLIHI